MSPAGSGLDPRSDPVRAGQGGKPASSRNWPSATSGPAGWSSMTDLDLLRGHNLRVGRLRP